ncbi:MAG TPA: BatA and WFA domain-containing protein [Candidatus Methanoperedens sp.]|nr:BatA and WFA domain-containing protein [Candidatus Methanoperedens sp.]HLB70874.1 BatA and WFA domain-containing protein [Candidatus Methanoperedens sp.]
MALNLFNLLSFANEIGLLALLSIIPLIIIYLLRPRPLKIKIPSLMFLMDIEKKKRLNVFRKFLKDPLFLIQLLVLTIAALTIAAPFILANEEAGGGHTVLVLDASASMQADGRFEKAVAEANKFLSSKNTVILAENVPVMVMKEAPSGSAADALTKLKAKATTADLSSAILLGRRILPEGGRIAVFSDFASWSGEDPAVAKQQAQGGGISVEFVSVTGRTDNIGIVNGWFEGRDYKIIVKNFNKDTQGVRIDVTTDGENVISSTLNIRGESSEYFAISDLRPGTTKISISSNDALAVDNNAYVIIPKSIERNILYITDNARSPLLVALKLIPFTSVNTAETKNIPSFSGIVFVSSPLPRDAITRLSDYVRGGGNAVIIASPGIENVELLPVELGAISNRTSLNVVRASRITEGISIERTDVKNHFKASEKKGAFTLVEGGDRSVMLAYWKYGRGTVIYSGLADPQGGNIYDPLNEMVWNDLHTLPNYPLFWKQMLEFISGSVDVTEYNARTGQYIKLPATQTIKTPADTVTTDTLLLDEVGVYDLPGKDVAVNLYDEKESNLAGVGISQVQQTETKEVQYNVQTIRAPKYLDIYFIMAVIFLVILELYYLHWRGEL